MTPFPEPRASAAVTCDLNKAQEKIVKDGFDPTSTFDVAMVNSILAQMRKHLLLREMLFRPVEHRPPQPKASDIAINLDLLDL